MLVKSLENFKISFWRISSADNIMVLILSIETFVEQNQGGKKKYSGRLLISASATVGALLLVALMCFWGCFLYKKFGKHDGKGLAMDVTGGTGYFLAYI